MTTADWLVITAGIAAILWVNWYFFFAQRPPSSSRTVDGTGGVQQDRQAQFGNRDSGHQSSVEIARTP